MNELSREARRVVEAGRAGDDPTDADRARLRRAVMGAVAAGGIATAGTAHAGAAAAKGVACGAAAASKTVSLGSVAAKVILGVALAGAVGAGVAVGTSGEQALRGDVPAATGVSPQHASAASPRGAQPGEGAAPVVRAEAEGMEERAPEAAPVAPPAGAEARARSLPRPSGVGSQAKASAGTGGAGGGSPSTLEDETRKLGEAHRALRSGDPERALKLLDEQSAAYAQGELREERAAARVLALCNAGKTAEASAAAASFLRENPLSPLADRVRAACAPQAPAAP